MAAVPARDAAAAGGMVNMTRGIGTALGVAIVTLGLHAGTLLRWPDAGLTLSMASLAAVALIATWAGRRGAPGVPLTSAVPDLPGACDVSGVPFASVIPDVPDVSGVSGVPDISIVSGVPGVFYASGVWGISGVFGVPDVSGSEPGGQPDGQRPPDPRADGPGAETLWTEGTR